MKRIDRKIAKYSLELSSLYFKMKNGEVCAKRVEKLSRKLDKLIIEKMTFTQND
jgi:hypothetical protein